MEAIKENINKVSKPGYKYTKLGWIPDDWKILPLGSIGEFSKGKGISKSEIKPEGLPCLTYGEIYTKHHDYIRSFNSFIDEESSRLSKAIFGGEVLFAGSGETLDEIGKCVAYLNKEKAYVGGDIIIFKPSRLDSLFLSYLLNSNFILRYRRKLGQGHSVVHIYSNGLKSLEIPIPPFSEQQKIAQILSTWDKAIEKMEQLIRAKIQLKKGLMQQLLTGKKRFKEFVISHDYVITRVGLIPKDWIVIPFSEVADKKVKWSLTGGPFGSNLKAEDFTEEGVRIVQLQNIGDGEFYNDYKIFTSEEKADELLSCNIFPGDIILSKMGDPVARACFIPKTRERFLMASDGIRLVPDKQLFDNLFVKEYINYKAFRRAAIRASTGSTRQRIGLTDLKELPFIKLKLKEQQKISSMLSVANEEINLLKSQLKKLISQKRGLMQKLLTGEIRVKTK